MPCKYIARWGLIAVTAAHASGDFRMRRGEPEPPPMPPQTAASDTSSAEKTSKTSPVQERDSA